jgi:hypothetical protein
MTNAVKLAISDITHRYPGQTHNQPVIADICRNGIVAVSYDPEIGGAVPAYIYYGIQRRVRLWVATRREVHAWYSLNKALLQRVVDGMGEMYNGQNNVGTLTEDAKDALDEIEYNSLYK